MLELGFVVFVVSAVSWFAYRVHKTHRDLVANRQQREMAFLAQYVRHPSGQAPAPSNQQAVSRD